MNNQEQIDYWNGESGKRWAEDDTTMARLLQPVCAALLDHAALAGCHSALDVGCGGGSQSLMLAEHLGAGSRVLGVDISEPMLAVARRKVQAGTPPGATVDFLQADAASHPFPPASFDLLFSRFGVMFFDDPVAAFSHMRGALRGGGRVAFCCWQAMKANDWVRIPLQAALQHLPPPEPPPANAPGPFAFADPDRVKSILVGAGFSQVALKAYTPTLRVAEGTANPAAAVRELARIGPVSRLLEGQPESVMGRVFPAMEAALQTYFRNGTLELPAAIWLVTASNA